MRYIITAGGTGGHLYPAIEVANKLILDGDEVLFIASKSIVDKKVLENVDFDVVYLSLKGFLRDKSLKSIFLNLINLFKLFIVFIRVIFIYLSFKPSSVIGFGGYITYPVVKIGSILKKRTYMHEQNSFPGLSNRMLSSCVDKIFYCYKSSLKYFDESKCYYTLNPRINNIYNYKKSDSFVLFLGGSLGAEYINELAIFYAKEHKNEKVVLVCGSNKSFNTELDNLTIYEFLDDQIKYMAKAKKIISRGGATTLLEIVALNKPALIIPSPNVVNDHQTVNANELNKLGYVSVIKEGSNYSDIFNVIDDLKRDVIFKEFDSLNMIVNILKESDK